jgi:hypothetical protein
MPVPHSPIFIRMVFVRFDSHKIAESDVTRCCENTIGPPEDGHVNARNMLRIVV